MVGMFRLVVAGQTRVVQLMTIVEEEPGVMIFSLNHFTPQLQRWEREKEPLRFLLTELTEAKAIFKCLSPQESLPDQINYQRPGQEALAIEFRTRGETTTLLQLTRMEK